MTIQKDWWLYPLTKVQRDILDPLRGPQLGNVYYVARSADGGDDNNDGVLPSAPLATIQAAIDRCASINLAGNNVGGDMIIVGRGNHATPGPVTFNKAGITVMAANFGMPGPVAGERATIAAAAGYDDGPAAIITQPCRIISLGFAGRQLAGESLLIDEGRGGWFGGFVSLESCRFSCWYGAITAGLRTKGGDKNQVLGCTFDGLFVGFGEGAIIMEKYVDNQITYGSTGTRIIGNYFSGVGTGKHAIVHKADMLVWGAVYAHNYQDAGFTGNIGKFLDNNDIASTGMIAGNYLGGMANKADAFENLNNSNLKFVDNHYEEA